MNDGVVRPGLLITGAVEDAIFEAPGTAYAVVGADDTVTTVGGLGTGGALGGAGLSLAAWWQAAC